MNTSYKDSGTQLYATLKRSSEHAHQQPGKEPFPVQIKHQYDSYCVVGNDNVYRLSDLKFWIKVRDKLVPLP